MGRHADERLYRLQDLERVERDTAKNLARRLGVSHRNLLKLRHLGLTADQADRFAVTLGHHPANIWPEWVDNHLTFLDRRFVEEGGWRDDWLQREATA